MIKKFLSQEQVEKSEHSENHDDLEINHVKITKDSSHNLKY